MKFLSVVLFLLLTAVKSSTARAQDGTFHDNTKTNGAAADFSVLITNDTKHKTADRSQQARRRRSLVQTEGYDQGCKQFFVGKIPPTGFQSSTGKDDNIRYICQKSGIYPFFSTMFDLNYGIPIYSAYVVKNGQVDFFGNAKRKGLNFHQEPVLAKTVQGSPGMYTNVPGIHKGHLVPAETYSFSPAHIRSTFTYTNAVPQYGSFNTGQWSAYERRIRNYAKNECAKKKNGDLYLLTGISDIQIYYQGGSVEAFIPPGTPKRMFKPPNIVIPNSMWTAGCCVNGYTAIGSFAVIGNNVPDKLKIKMTQLENVQVLEKLIGVKYLFPGNMGCYLQKKTVKI